MYYIRSRKTSPKKSAASCNRAGTVAPNVDRQPTLVVSVFRSGDQGSTQIADLVRDYVDRAAAEGGPAAEHHAQRDDEHRQTADGRQIPPAQPELQTRSIDPLNKSVLPFMPDFPKSRASRYSLSAHSLTSSAYRYCVRSALKLTEPRIRRDPLADRGGFPHAGTILSCVTMVMLTWLPPCGDYTMAGGARRCTGRLLIE